MLEHRFPVTAATKKKRTWAGLVCPVCRFVFRVPKDHDGAGVICPACHYLLNIPGSEREEGTPVRVALENNPKTLVPKPRNQKESKPIVSRPLSEKDTLPAASEASSTSSSRGSSSTGQKRVRRKKHNSQASPDWESKTTAAPSAPGNPMPWIVGGSLLGLTIVGIGAWLVIDSVNEKDVNDGIVTTVPTIMEPVLVKEDEMTDEEKKRQQEIADSVKTGMNVLTDAEKVVRLFLDAKTATDIEALVRTPDITIPRIRAWYAEDKWTPPGAKDVGYGGRVTVKGVMASMAVRLNDYTVKQIALENTPDGYKVDWESWVAWSSMKWEKLFEELPTEPVEVRVHCSLDSYYNRIFSDDFKWIAVRLEHPYSERAIYGYIDKGSPLLMRMLGDLRNRGTVAATIKIRYPENSVAKNQVQIIEYIQNGWVRPNDEAEVDKKSTEE